METYLRINFMFHITKMKNEDKVKNEIPQWKINMLLVLVIRILISMTAVAIIHMGRYISTEMGKP